jgi:hypothetical protein
MLYIPENKSFLAVHVAQLIATIISMKRQLDLLLE